MLTITGTPSQINAALATLTYTPLADFNTDSSDFTVTMVTNDGVAAPATSTFTIAVTPVADIVADTVTTNEDTALTFNPIAGTGGSEADNFENAGAQITSITPPAIGSAVLNGDGTITYTPPANYNGTTTMTYTVTSGGVTETATITITVASVNDAPVAQNDAFATNQDTAVNGNLFADNGSGADVDVDDPLAVTLVNGAALSSGSTITLPSGALLVVNSDGTFSYDPNNVFDSLPEGQTATDSFTYTVRDPSGASSTATVTITITGLDDALAITGLNDGPNGTDGAVNESDLLTGSTPAGTGEVLNGTLTLTAVDGIGSLVVNGTAVTVLPTPGNPVVFTGLYGTLSVTNYDASTGIVTYQYVLTQPANQSGGNVTDDFVISLTDRDGDTVNGTLAIQINDDQPTANPDANSIVEDAAAPVTGNVLTNDVLGADRTGGAVSAISFGATAGTVGSALAGDYGNLTLNANGSYSYGVDNANPAVQALQQGETLTEVFTYTYTDGDGDAVTSTLTITINGQNDAPVANNDSVAVTEDTPASGNVLTNDTDADGDTLVVSGFSFGGNNYTPGQTATIVGVGSLVINANGTFTFTPALNYNGAVPSATYTVSDGEGGTDTATLTIGPVDPVNDAPVAVNDVVPVTEDTTVTGNLLTNDSDVDGDALQVTGFVVNGNSYGPGSTVNLPGVGMLTIDANGAYTFDPEPNYNGSSSAGRLYNFGRQWWDRFCFASAWTGYAAERCTHCSQ
ncbi:MAG: Ig-like domain-containing protein [Mesorhizobium sp.]